MTETYTEAVVAPQATPAPPVEKPPEPAPPTATVDHTPGGWPVLPLAVTGTNSAVGIIAAAAVAGGPVAAAVAATGAAALGTAAAIRSTRTARKNSPRRRNVGRTGRTMSAAGLTRAMRSSSAGRIPSSGRKGGGTGSGSGRSGHSLLKSSGSKGRSTGTTGTAGGAKQRSGASGGRGGAGAGRSALGLGRSTGRSPGGAGGRIGQVRALRQAQRQQAPTRSAARTQGTANRRNVADARRGAHAAGRTAGASSRGAVARTAARTLRSAGRISRAAIGRARQAADRRTQGRVDNNRAAVRHAVARRRARSALWRSAARMHGRRLFAALLAAPFGVLGALTTPLGRKLGWAWLQYPGRRLYQRMMRSAQERRAARDAAARERLAAEKEALDAAAAGDTAEIGDTVQRPFRLAPATNITPVEVVNMSGFKFEEAAAEMEAAAASYDPDGSMEILAMIEGLPDALTSVANTMKILGERSDSEFPLEKAVAETFRDCFGAVMAAVSVAEEMGPIFRRVHEADIARHEDPRNGPEAEKGWNV